MNKDKKYSLEELRLLQKQLKEIETFRAKINSVRFRGSIRDWYTDEELEKLVD